MQIIKKEGLIQGLNLHLKEQILVLMSPLVQDLQQDLQIFHPNWLIFRKIAPDRPKWVPETPGMCQMGSFRMVFIPKYENNF